MAGHTDLKHVVGTGRVFLGGGMGGVSSSAGGGTIIGDRKGGRGVLGNQHGRNMQAELQYRDIS